MTSKLWLFLLVGLAIIGTVYALDCEYQDSNTNETTEFLPFLNGTQLKTVDIIINPDWWAPLRINNLNDVNLSIKIDININAQYAQWCTTESLLNNMRSFNAIVPNKSFVEIEVVRTTNSVYCKNFRFTEPYYITYFATGDVDVQPVQVTKTYTVCKECPADSGIICKNDGVSCAIAGECGGGYCVLGLCSDSKRCYNNDCKCSENEVQCPDNTGCAVKNSKEIGEKPVCSPEECTTKYIDPKTGECAKRPGSPCENSIECGSIECIRGYCSNNTCFNNDCQCGENEVQCLDNRSCVVKHSVQLGFNSTCIDDECIMGCINPDTEKCAKKDGTECTPHANSTECCSTICNIDGFCGSEFIIPCSEGKLNCNNETCVAPSIKKLGEAYSCEWECKSGVGKDGVCTMNNVQWAITILIILIIGGFVIYYFYIHTIKKAGKVVDELTAKQEKLKKLENEINENNKRIEILKEEIANAEGIAKEKLEIELEKVTKTRSLIEKEKVRIEEETKLIESVTKKSIESKLKNAKDKYGHEFILDEDGYLRFKYNPAKTGPGGLLHIYNYEKGSGEWVDKNNYDVHHIDGDRYNCDYWNLIKLSNDIHGSKATSLNRIIHKNIRDYESGIKELERIGIEIPERCKDKLNDILANKRNTSQNNPYQTNKPRYIRRFKPKRKWRSDRRNKR